MEAAFEENPRYEVSTSLRILTKDEEKFVDKNYGDIRKQVQDAFKKKSN